jgi:hypothetical protein
MTSTVMTLNSVELRPPMTEEVSKHVDPNACTWVRVRPGSELYRPLLQYISKTAQNSFEMETAPKGKAKNKGGKALTVSGVVAADAGMSTQMKAGLGMRERADCAIQSAFR